MTINNKLFEESGGSSTCLVYCPKQMADSSILRTVSDRGRVSVVKGLLILVGRKSR